MSEKNTPLQSFFYFSKDQKKGILVLFGIIVLFQISFYFLNFNASSQDATKKQKWLALQGTLKITKEKRSHDKVKMYPFNPNFITDFKGYKLGMSAEQITKLFAYRKQGKYVNTSEEFQKVTGISDSLLNAISIYFKFPDWVGKKQQNDRSGFSKSKWKEFPKKEPIKILDINLATKEELMKVNGIGDAISDRILRQKQVYGAFVSMDQMNDVWGLSPEVIEKINLSFKIISAPKPNKININDASIKELSQFPYFRFPISKNIVTYRSMNGNIKIEDLLKIKGFPVDKIKIIALYLEF